MARNPDLARCAIDAGILERGRLQGGNTANELSGVDRELRQRFPGVHRELLDTLGQL